jgi:uridylate kinase
MIKASKLPLLLVVEYFRGVAGASNEWTVCRRLHGMLATVINGMVLHEALEDKGMLTRLQTAPYEIGYC